MTHNVIGMRYMAFIGGCSSSTSIGITLLRQMRIWRVVEENSKNSLKEVLSVMIVDYWYVSSCKSSKYHTMHPLGITLNGMGMRYMGFIGGYTSSTSIGITWLRQMRIWWSAKGNSKNSLKWALSVAVVDSIGISCYLFMKWS